MPGAVFLSGHDLSLNTIDKSDLDFLQELVNHPEVRETTSRSMPINRSQEEDYFNSHICDENTIHLLIVSDGDPVGTISLDPINWSSRRAEIGYCVSPVQQNKGYGTKATQLLVEYAFDELGLHKMTANVLEYNKSSIKLLERIGFTVEGKMRDAEFVNGVFQDMHRYGILENEWHNMTDDT